MQEWHRVCRNSTLLQFLRFFDHQHERLTVPHTPVYIFILFIFLKVDFLQYISLADTKCTETHYSRTNDDSTEWDQTNLI